MKRTAIGVLLGGALLGGALATPAGGQALAAGPAATGEAAPIPLVSRRLPVWGLYGYDSPGTAAASQTVPVATPVAAPAGTTAGGATTGGATTVPRSAAGTSAGTSGAAPAPRRRAEAAPSGGGTDWNWILGLGIGYTPDYEGSDNYEVIPAWLVRAEREDNIYGQLRGTRLSGNVLADSIFRLGPIVNYRMKRDDVDDSKVDRLDEVDATIEVGAFVGVEMDFGDGNDDIWGVEFEALQGTGGGHSGFLGTLALYYRTMFGDSWRLGLRGHGTWASDDYMEEYFGIDNQDAARSGLAQYDASSDIKDMGGALDLSYAFSKSWGGTLLVSYTRLLGDAEDSPIVDESGDENQFFGALMGTYRF